jgi:hypothetical protein
MPPRGMVMLLVFAALLAGCRMSQSDSDARDRHALEKTVAEQRAELASVKMDRDKTRRLLDESLAAKPSADNTTAGGRKPFAFNVTKVEFSFLTCGINLEGAKGDDDGIAAYVDLYDQYDTPMKAAGHFQFDLFDLARSKDYVVQSWSFEPEAAALHWQRFPACYQFKLPLSGEVRATKVVLKVTFRQADGKEFATTTELKLERP